MAAVITSSNIPLESVTRLGDLYRAPTDPPVEYFTNTVASILDLGKVVLLTSGSAISYTIPSNSTVANPLPLYTVLIPVQGGAGALSIVGGAGVTINGVVAGTVTLASIAEGVCLWQRSDNNWLALNRTAA